MADNEDKKIMKKVDDILNSYTDDMKITDEEIQKEIENAIKYDIKDEPSSSEEESSSSDEDSEKRKKKKKKKNKKKKKKKKDKKNKKNKE